MPTIGVLQTLNAASRTPLGGILENQVASDLVSQGIDLSGWKKTPSGIEIDFVAKMGGRTIPIECKATLDVKRTHCKGIVAYLRQHELGTGVVVSFAPQQLLRFADNLTVLNIPAYRLASLGQLMVKWGEG